MTRLNDTEKPNERTQTAQFESVPAPNCSDSHKDLPLKQALQQYSKYIYHILGLATVIILWGYDLVVVGSITAVDPFLRDFGEFDRIEDGEEKWIIPAMWLSLWQAMPCVGQLVGAVTAGRLQDKIGRKTCLLIGSVITALSVLIEVMAYKAPSVNGKRGVFLAGKVVQGCALALVKMVTLTFVSETAPTCLRGAAMAIFPAFNLLGQLLGALVVFGVNQINDKTGYLIAFGVQWVFSIAPFAMAFMLPESPAYLVREKKIDAARASLVRLYAPKNNIDELLQNLTRSIEEEHRITEDITYAQCFKGTNRRRSLIVIFANLLPPLFGLPLLTSSSYFLQQVGMSSTYSLMMLIIGIVVGTIANLGSTWTLSHIGRRRLIISTLLLAGGVWGAMGIIGCVPSQGYTPWLTAALLMLVIIVCGLGVWPTSYAIMSEVSALRLRAPSQAIGGIAAYISSIFTNFVLPYLYNPDAADLKAKTGFVFMGCCVLAAGATWLVVPEMKGRSVGDVDRMFQEGVGARESRKWPSRGLKSG
ncbi:MFS general substrate transporter [Karstenula rhodostoma CBS 690.94]|uniref:MFS general substrate transporter n=1 Tax=Karstenula rhodostoma CBS 690.94 TaxID=1392251 RepID=A0A9P4PVU4_9PLEO|nr:MFS general substrate transporter [Karstenula rhodostoma CBS 690.94]